MIIINYTEQCVKFAKDSKNWSRLPNNFYTAKPNSEYQESSDNADGGIDVSWAFKKSVAEIREDAHGIMLDLILQEIKILLNDDCEKSIIIEFIDDWN